MVVGAPSLVLALEHGIDPEMNEGPVFGILVPLGEASQGLGGLSGRVLNYSEVARALGVSQRTARDYLDTYERHGLLGKGGLYGHAIWLEEREKARLREVEAGLATITRESRARALEAGWSGELSGLVVTRYGHAVPCERIKVVEAAHPVPDAAGSSAPASDFMKGRIMSIGNGKMVVELLVPAISFSVWR